MPPVSEAQRKAMYAALNGNSNLDIPKSVAEKFVGKQAHDMSEEDWGELRKTLMKWIGEEEREPEHAGDDLVTAPNSAVPVGARKKAEDAPSGKLNEKERAEAEKSHGAREDMPGEAFLEPASRKYPVKTEHDGKWAYSRDLLLAAAREARMHGDGSLADRADAIRAREFGGANDAVAMDRESVRQYDQDGHLHIAHANISKANVCPYNGREIPNFEQFGLDPNKVYRLYRAPEELARGAASFHGKPLLITHKPTSANDHPRSLTVGTVMNPVFEDPFLKAELVIWDGEAIEGIEDDSQRELSAGYRYRADMTPGSANGEPYDGVMRDIVGNHQALVEEGRAGPEVIVGDGRHVKHQAGGRWLL